MAMIIQRIKMTIYLDCMDRNPGIPPTPMEFAMTPELTERIAARAEPIIAATNG